MGKRPPRARRSGALRPGGAPRARLPWLPWTWAAILVALGLAHALWLRFLCDDAYISFRYALHWSGGLGPVFNPGERVEGFSNLSWTALCALLMRAGFKPEVAAPLIGLAAWVATLALLVRRLARRGGPVWPGALLLAASFPAAAWATGGLETALFGLLLLAGVSGTWSACTPREGGRWSVRGLALSGFWLGLASVTRPEGALVTACVGLWLLTRARTPGRRLEGLAAWGAGWLLVVGPVEAWRFSYYGQLLPQSARVKLAGLSGLPSGAAYVASWLVRGGVSAVLALLVALGARARGRTLLATEPALAACVVLPYLAFVAISGGDFMAGYRFLAPLAALLAWGTGRALGEWVAAWRPGPAGGRALFVAALIAAHLALNLHDSAENQGDWERGSLRSVGAERRMVADWHETARALGRVSRPGDTLATSAAGIIPYETGLYTIDLLGLVAPDLSPYRHRPGALPGHRLMLRGEWLDRRPPQILLGHPLVQRPLEFKAPSVDLEPEWRKPVLDHYYMFALDIAGEPPGFVVCGVRSDLHRFPTPLRSGTQPADTTR